MNDEPEIVYTPSGNSLNWSNITIPASVPGTATAYPQFVSGVSTMLATLTEGEKENIRRIVAEEVAKVFPIPHTKPNVGIPQCPECHGWVLDEHDPLTPLDTVYRSWWCTCPEKVKAWEEKCQKDLDRLMEAIHNPDSEIEAILVEMSDTELEELIAKVRARRSG